MVIWDHRPRIKGGLQVSNMKVKCAMTGMIHNTPNILFSECGLRSISHIGKWGSSNTLNSAKWECVVQKMKAIAKSLNESG